MLLVSDQYKESRARRGIFLTTLRETLVGGRRLVGLCSSYSVDILTQTLRSIILQSHCRDPLSSSAISSASKLLQGSRRWTKPEASNELQQNVPFHAPLPPQAMTNSLNTFLAQQLRIQVLDQPQKLKFWFLIDWLYDLYSVMTFHLMLSSMK